MKWELSFCTAEIEDNKLIVQLKLDYKSIKESFKFYGKYYQFRSILENFGYDIFKKALKRHIMPLNPLRIEQFKTFFDTIQKYEAGPVHAEPPRAESWKVDKPVTETKHDITLSACPRCGASLPTDLEEVRFCPECGAPLKQ